MATLTAKEKSYLEDAISMENLFITKLGVYADQSQDQSLKNLLFQISKNKRDHATTLKQMLQADRYTYQ